MKENIRWGVIGCGRISHRFMQGLQVISNASYTGAWSRRPETVDAFADQYGGKVFRSIEEILNAEDIDAVYIATLPDSHKQYSIAALQAGKHVLCEKPSALYVSELEEILTVARQQKLLFMEGMKPPFFPLYRRLKTHLQTNGIGEVRYIRAGSAVADLTRDHPNFSYELGGGSLTSIGIYEAFLAIDWLGNLVDLQTLGRFEGTPVDIFSVFQSRHENGFAQLYCGLDVHGYGDALIAGTQGRIIIHKNWWNPAKATISYLDGRTVELDEPFEHGGLNYETEHFCQLIREGKTESPVITHELSRQMLTMIDQARHQVGLYYEGERK
ncbi:Gfo/Idh/MocA family oxidoreductase [Mucilaginibacter koreensis]